MLSCVQLFAIPWTIACQAPLSMGVSRQEYWSRLPFPTLELHCLKCHQNTALKKKYSIKSHWESQYPFPSSMGKEELPSPTFLSMLTFFQGFPTGTSGKEPTCQCRRHKRFEFDPWILKISWRRAQKPTPVFSPGESHGHRT